MPTDPAPQVETRTEWRNVYRDKDAERLGRFAFSTREEADAVAMPHRVAVERVEGDSITRYHTTRRHPVAAPEDV